MRANDVDHFWTKVQKSDGCWTWTDDTSRDGYGRFCLDGRKHLAHRLSYAWSHGPIPAGNEVDHICGNRACVNPAHLRSVTKFLNMQNRSSANSNSRSGFRGVYRSNGRWRAAATMNRVVHHIGYFDSPEEAGAAVSAWRRDNMPYSEMDKKEVA